MARITAGIGSSHVPAIGAAFDLGKSQDPYWKPVFAGFEWVKEFQRKEDPDVVILCYNDHASAMMLDVVPTVMGDPVLPMQCSRILPVSTCRSGAPAA